MAMNYYFIRNNKVYEKSAYDKKTKEIKIDKRIKDITAIYNLSYEGGDTTAFILNENGGFFVLDYDWNIIKSYDNIVYASTYNDIFSCVDIDGKIISNLEGFAGSPDDVFFVKVSNSDDNLLAIDVDGNIWAFGSNMHGKSGLTLSTENIPELQQITKDINFVKVETSGIDSLALDDQGNIYLCGLFFPLVEKLNQTIVQFTPMDFEVEVEVENFWSLDRCIILVDTQGNSYGIGDKFDLGLGPHNVNLEDFTDEFTLLDFNFVPDAIVQLVDPDFRERSIIIKDTEGNLYTNTDEEYQYNLIETSVDALVNENPRPNRYINFAKTKSARKF